MLAEYCKKYNHFYIFSPYEIIGSEWSSFFTYTCSNLVAFNLELGEDLVKVIHPISTILGKQPRFSSPSLSDNDSLKLEVCLNYLYVIIKQSSVNYAYS